MTDDKTETIRTLADVAADMRLSILDAWRLDGRPPTAAELVQRYGFEPGHVTLLAELAGQQAAQDFADQLVAESAELLDQAVAVAGKAAIAARTYVAGAGAAGAMPGAGGIAGRAVKAVAVALVALACAVLLPAEASAAGDDAEPLIFDLPPGAAYVRFRFDDVDPPRGGPSYQAITPKAGIVFRGPGQTRIGLQVERQQIVAPIWHGGRTTVTVEIGGRF